MKSQLIWAAAVPDGVVADSSGEQKASLQRISSLFAEAQRKDLLTTHAAAGPSRLRFYLAHNVLATVKRLEDTPDLKAANVALDFSSYQQPSGLESIERFPCLSNA